MPQQWPQNMSQGVEVLVAGLGVSPCGVRGEEVGVHARPLRGVVGRAGCRHHLADGVGARDRGRLRSREGCSCSRGVWSRRRGRGRSGRTSAVSLHGLLHLAVADAADLAQLVFLERVVHDSRRGVDVPQQLSVVVVVVGQLVLEVAPGTEPVPFGALIRRRRAAPPLELRVAELIAACAGRVRSGLVDGGRDDRVPAKIVSKKWVLV